MYLGSLESTVKELELPSASPRATPAYTSLVLSKLRTCIQRHPKVCDNYLFSGLALIGSLHSSVIALRESYISLVSTENRTWKIVKSEKK